MCYGKVVRNSYSSVEQFLLSSRVITACLRLLHSVSQWFSTFSLKGAKPRSMILWESRTKKILTQVNSHVLYYYGRKSATQDIRGFIHRRSQGGLWGYSPLILEHTVVLCFGRRYPKQNSVNSFPKKKIFWPPQYLGWLRCWWCSIWSDCGVMFQTLIVAAGSMVANRFNRSDL